MKYIGMPFAVWQFFCASFEKNLPKFEKGDRFQMNIVGCAMLTVTHTHGIWTFCLMPIIADMRHGLQGAESVP